MANEEKCELLLPFAIRRRILSSSTVTVKTPAQHSSPFLLLVDAAAFCYTELNWVKCFDFLPRLVSAVMLNFRDNIWAFLHADLGKRSSDIWGRLQNNVCRVQTSGKE